jgi:hypothetical protein
MMAVSATTCPTHESGRDPAHGDRKLGGSTLGTQRERRPDRARRHEVAVYAGNVTVYQVYDLWSWLRHHPATFSVVLITVGVLVVIAGVLGVRTSSSDFSKLEELRAGGGSVEQGTFTGAEMVKTSRPGRDRVRYCPRYAYTATDGVERTIVDDDSCASIDRAPKRKTIRILVDTDDPSTAFIDERKSSVGRTSSVVFSWSMLTLGGGLLIAAPIVAIRGRRREQIRNRQREARQ